MEFGSDFPGVMHLDMMVTVPADGCATLSNTDDVLNRTALVKRGYVEFN